MRKKLFTAGLIAFGAAALFLGWRSQKPPGGGPRVDAPPAAPSLSHAQPQASALPSDDAGGDPLSTAGLVLGRVVRADGRAAPGAKVGALGSPASAVSLADGSFSLALPAGAHRVTASLGGETAATPAALLVVAGKTSAGVVLRLGAACAFEGLVTDAGGDRIADAQVTALARVGAAHAGGGEPVTAATAATDGAGRFSIDSLAPGQYDLRAAAAGFTEGAIGPLAIAAGQRVAVSLQLSRTAALEGTVRDERGRPLAATVRASDDRGLARSASTDSGGRYRIVSLSAGRSWVAAERAGVAGEVDQRVQLTAGQTGQLDFVLPAGGELRGVVTQQSGARAASAKIEVIADSYQTVATLSADETGSYRASLLPGPYELRASSGKESGQARAALRAGQTATADVKLAPQAPEPSRAITGVVLDANGDPAAGAWVGVRSPRSLAFSSGPLEVGSALAGPEGEFSVTPFFYSGSAVTIVAHGGSGFGSVAHVSSGDDIVVHLQPAAALTGTVRGLDGDRFEACVAPHESAAPAGSPGCLSFTGDQLSFSDLPAVPSVLRVTEGGRAASVELSLTPGETATADVSLGEKQTVSLRAVDAETHQPLSQGSVQAPGEGWTELGADGRGSLQLASGNHVLEFYVVNHDAPDLPIAVADGPLDLGDIALRSTLAPGGVGISWAPSNTPTIARLLPGGPAEKAGLLPGDIVESVDGAPLPSTSFAALMIRGPVGSSVTLAVLRGEASFDVALVRVDMAALEAPRP